MSDGPSVRFVSKTIAEESFKALMTPSGGEKAIDIPSPFVLGRDLSAHSPGSKMPAEFQPSSCLIS
jgi:hypothetical protein